MAEMMEASETALQWQSFNQVKKGLRARDGVAHRGELASKADCLAYIEAIERELVAWAVL
jgi:hypothetical protein